jgi:transcription-repair coupling factor (superfamily II helicase)
VLTKSTNLFSFASRGDILDIFSVSALFPTRIEFFDDVVDSLRNFDIASQSSTSEIDSLTILPASDNLLSDNQLNEAASRIKKQLEEDEKTLSPSAKEMIEENVTRDLEDIVSRNYKPTLYKYYGFSLSSPYSIVSYFSPKSIFIANKEQFIQNCDILLNEAHQYYGELKADCRIISHLDEYMTLDEAFT